MIRIIFPLLVSFVTLLGATAHAQSGVGLARTGVNAARD